MTDPINTRPVVDVREQAAEESERQELVRTVSEIIGNAFARDEALVFRLAQAVIDGLRERGHRGAVYIPAASREDRDRAIRAEFNGSNWQEVCRKHGLKRRALYYILNRGRDAG